MRSSAFSTTEYELVEAARLYGLAAAQGQSLAQRKLGCLYDNGEGVARDYVEAEKLAAARLVT